jgi:hypothetical protein
MLMEANADIPLLISCFFGGQVRTVYPAIRGRYCVFFSNSQSYRSLVEARGWQFRLVESLPINFDYRQSSIQAKYIKFLQFFDEFPDLAVFNRIIYFDHTVYFRRHDLNWLQSRHTQDRQALVLRHLSEERTIWGEVEAAYAQERYALSMPETINWLRSMERDGVVRLDGKVDATTIISYRNPRLIREFLDEVYAQTIRLQQPECQIIWSALGQRYASSIQRVDWHELEPLWRVPYHSKRDIMFDFSRRVVNRVRRQISG